MRILFLFFSLLSSNLFTQNNSVHFSYDEFISIVQEHHPISFQAGLKTETGKAKLLKARGGFDPKLQGELYQKYFDGKQYYSYFNAGLKIPTWYGISVQGGYSKNDGYYLNPESKTSNNGLMYAGVTVNLAKDLLINKRQAELKQAKIYVNSTVLEQKMILNQLNFDASIAYWNWFKAFNKVAVYKNALDLSDERYEGVVLSAFLGEKPFVDTLKAVINVQNRKLKLKQSELELFNKKSLLETFLWQDGNLPLEIDSTLKPLLFLEINTTKPNSTILLNMDSLVNNHPEMLYYKYDIDIAKIDIRLQKNNLLPKLELKYNFLHSSTNNNFIGDYSIENYQWGAKLSYPIFIRKERANLQLSKIKIEEKESKFENKKELIKYKLLSAHQSWLSTKDQVDLYSKAVNNYNSLFKAEHTLFNMGESSLFLLNYREQELIKAQIKLIELITTNYFYKENYTFQTIGY